MRPTLSQLDETEALQTRLLAIALLTIVAFSVIDALRAA
jgi:hypothetical protein